MPCKKELAERFNLGSNTVYRTLQCTPLGTNKKDYSEEEIQEFFVPAREMLDVGQTYQQVAQYFGIKDTPLDEADKQESSTNRESTSSRSAGGTNISATEVVEAELSVAAAVAVDEVAAKSVKNVAPYVGDLLMHKLAEELQEGGAIRESIDNMNRELKERDVTNSVKSVNAGAAFLLEKMKARPLQLTGAPKQVAQLPEAASIEPCENNSEEQSEN